MTSSPPWGPDTGQARAATVIGIDGYPVEASAAIANGPPGLQILGLHETGSRETRDQVRAAILNSGEGWPGRAAPVALRPASRPNRGSSFALAIAAAVPPAPGAIPASAAEGCV